MSLRDLVTFAQNEISHRDVYETREFIPEPPPESDERLILPLPEDSNFIAERPPWPAWIVDPENEIIRIGGPSSAIFSESAFDEPIVSLGGAVPAQGPDALAYYLPYHFYRDGIWGIYLRAKGILELAAELKGAPITHGSDAAVQAACVSLLEHEQFHCLTEAAATRSEVVVRSPVYHPYFWDRYATFHEEAVANACAHGAIKKEHPAFVARLESWMRSQGPGYRDFHRYAGRSLRKGKLKCSHHIIRFAPPGVPLPSKLPSDFLFRKVRRVPTYLVVDAEIARSVLRPFPNYNGVVIKVHTAEGTPPHPPHIHVEMPVGEHVTRCQWPSLEPLDHDPALSGKQQARLREYLQRYGTDICEKLRSIYGSPNLPMLTF